MFSAGAHNHASGGLVSFAPDARSASHTHPGDHGLILFAGIGWLKQEGGRKARSSRAT